MNRNAIARTFRGAARWAWYGSASAEGGRHRETSARVVALRPAGEGTWKAVEADLSGPDVTVTGAWTFRPDSHPAGKPPWRSEEAEGILLLDSDRAVCRRLEVPAVPDDSMRRILEHRLEVELPFAVSDAAWAWDRRPRGSDAATTEVLVVAVPAEELDEAESAAEEAGVRRGPGAVELAIATLAELARGSDDAETARAVLAPDSGGATLVIASGAGLEYVRRIRGGSVFNSRSAEGSPRDRLAGELDQTLRDFGRRGETPPLDELLVLGAPPEADRLVARLEGRVPVPVRRVEAPADLRSAEGAPTASELMAEFPECVGALLAARRRRSGGAAVAPALGRRRTGRAKAGRGRQAVLLGANGLLLALLVAGSFGVRSARLDAANRFIEEAQPVQKTLNRLREEVEALKNERWRRRSALDALLALAEALPGGVQTDSLKIDPDGTLTMTGRTSAVETISERAVTALEASPAFTDARFWGATRGEGGFTFRLTCRLQPTAGGAAP